MNLQEAIEKAREVNAQRQDERRNLALRRIATAVECLGIEDPPALSADDPDRAVCGPLTFDVGDVYGYPRLVPPGGDLSGFILSDLRPNHLAEILAGVDA